MGRVPPEIAIFLWLSNLMMNIPGMFDINKPGDQRFSANNRF